MIVSSSPHLRGKTTTQSIMRDVIIALIPAEIAAIVIFGFRALLLSIVCIASSVIFEYLIRMVLKRSSTISDLSAVVTGLLVSLNLPSTFPFWMAVIGCFVAIVVVKQMFGGIGQNFVNPAIAARVVLTLSFTTQMASKTAYLIPQLSNGIERVAGATPLAILKNGTTDGLPSLMDMFIGLRGGCMGETCALALIVGGVYLIIRRVINPVLPVCFLGTIFVLSWALGSDPFYQILSGGAMLAAFFMITDYTTSPTRTPGKIIFAVGCGVITVLIRIYSSSYPEGISFAILFMNILVPLIDRCTKSKPFGGVKG